jgi:hypothetical protein
MILIQEDGLSWNRAQKWKFNDTSLLFLSESYQPCSLDDMCLPQKYTPNVTREKEEVA